MWAVSRACVLCCLCVWSWTAQAEDARFTVHLDFTDAGVAPPIQEQVRQALPQLWMRLVPASEQGNLRDVRAMSLLRSIHPHGLNSDVVFHEQRVWDVLKSRALPYILKPPRMHLSLAIFNTVGQQERNQERLLYDGLIQEGERLGMALNASAPALAFHVQWLNDVQFYVSAKLAGQTTLRQQNQWTSGVDAAQQLRNMMHAMLAQIRDAHVQNQHQAASETMLPETAIALHRFHLHVDGLRTLSTQVVLEHALSEDARVHSLIPEKIHEGSVDYAVVTTSPPETWLEYWFDDRGMTASESLDGWLAQ